MAHLLEANKIVRATSTSARGLRKTAVKVSDSALKALEKLSSEGSSKIDGTEKEQLEAQMHRLVKCGGAVDSQCQKVESACSEISKTTLQLRDQFDSARLASQLRTVQSLVQTLQKGQGSFEQQVKAGQGATERWAARSTVRVAATVAGVVGVALVGGGLFYVAAGSLPVVAAAGALTARIAPLIGPLRLFSSGVVSFATRTGLARRTEAANTPLDATEERLRQLQSVLQESQPALSKFGDTISDMAKATDALLRRLQSPEAAN